MGDMRLREVAFRGKPDRLAAIEHVLAEQGFRRSDAKPGALTMSKPASLAIFQLTNLACDLEELATEHAATYDGWGAAVVKR